MLQKCVVCCPRSRSGSAWSSLVRHGLLRTDGRRGTTVLDRSSAGADRYRRALGRPNSLRLDLSTGVPDGALLPELTEVLANLQRAGTPSSYLEEPVVPELAERLRADWPYPDIALTVVDGAMDALDLLTQTVLRAGDRVVVEHPRFPPILDILEALSVEIIGVPMDEQGLDPESLRAALTTSVAAVVIQPRAHNPTGVTMTRDRAEDLAALLSECAALVVEDDSAHGLSPTPALSLGEWLPDRTVHVRSFSKSYGPDLRLPAMSGPADLMRAVDARRHRGQGWSSRLLQRILLGLLTNSSAADQVRAAQHAYADRRSQFVEALTARGVETRGSQGINVWVPVADETAAVAQLASQGIGVSAGAPFAVLPGMPGHIRVTVGLVRKDHEGLAEVVAGAAVASGRAARTR